MKKNFILFAIIFVFGICNISLPQFKVISESDLQIRKTMENYIEKNINAVNTYRYDIDSGVVGTEAEKISSVVLDLNKKTYTEYTYYPNYSKSVMVFDNNNNITDISIYYQDNSLTSRVITNYESKNEQKNKIYYFGNSMTFKVENKYSSEKIVRQDYVDSLGKIISYGKIFYDNSGNLIEEDKYNMNDSLDIVYQYSYDNSGNCIEEIVNYPSADYTSKSMFKYDNRRNKVESVMYGIGGKMTLKNRYKYSESGLLIEETSYSLDDKLTAKNEYRYDENGNKTEWKYTDLVEDFEYLYKYVYNEK